MSNIVELDNYRPHFAANVECPCGHKWIAVYPEKLLTDSLECPGCNKMIPINKLLIEYIK